MPAPGRGAAADRYQAQHHNGRAGGLPTVVHAPVNGVRAAATSSSKPAAAAVQHQLLVEQCLDRDRLLELIPAAVAGSELRLNSRPAPHPASPGVSPGLLTTLTPSSPAPSSTTARSVTIGEYLFMVSSTAVRVRHPPRDTSERPGGSIDRGICPAPPFTARTRRRESAAMSSTTHGSLRAADTAPSPPLTCWP
jgi:hypothetical protein